MKADSKKQHQYLSYLLRLWQTRDGKRKVWHASLESPGTGNRQSFKSIEDLFEFLQRQTGSYDLTPQPPKDTGR